MKKIETIKPLVKILKEDFDTDPITEDPFKRYRDHFHKTLNPGLEEGTAKFPYAVWVDKSIIKDAFKDEGVDGFRIYPIRYSEDGSHGTFVFKKDKVNLAIVLTHPNGSGKHKDDLSLAFDYNDPCPKPPCN